MAEGGFSPSQIDEMEWWQFEAYLEWRADHPSVEAMVASYFGVKPRFKMKHGPGGVFDQDWIKNLDRQLAKVIPN